MPTLVITGHPCCGKSTFAALLASRALSHKSGRITSTVVISEETACPDRTKYQCYESSRAEKSTRGALKAEFDKYCTSSTSSSAAAPSKDGGDGARGGAGGGGDDRTKRLIILDGTNYIKGYRYELHCIAKAAGERHGVVWVLCDANTADGWNRERRRERNAEKKKAGNKAAGEGDDDAAENYYYTDAQMEELRLRYEPPDERNRWDRPLYRVDVKSTLGQEQGGGGGEAAEEALRGSVYDMHALSEVMSTKSRAAEVEAEAPSSPSSAEATTEAAGPKKKPSSSSAFKKAKKKKKPASSAFRRAAAPVSRKKEEEGDVASTPAEAEAAAFRPTQQSCASSDAEFPSPASSSNDAPSPPSPRQRKTMEELVDEILDSFLSKEVTPLKQGMSTTKPVTTNANVLHDVDAVTQKVSADFLTAQKSVASVGSGRVSVPIGSGGGGGGGETTSESVNLTRTVTLPELKRMRRQYVKWIADHPPRDTSEAGIASSFLSYVESQL